MSATGQILQLSKGILPSLRHNLSRKAQSLSKIIVLSGPLTNWTGRQGRAEPNPTEIILDRLRERQALVVAIGGNYPRLEGHIKVGG